eukprot:8658200-Heterocapsa_arctica.AAC.1
MGFNTPLSGLGDISVTLQLSGASAGHGADDGDTDSFPEASSLHAPGHVHPLLFAFGLENRKGWRWVRAGL